MEKQEYEQRNYPVICTRGAGSQIFHAFFRKDLRDLFRDPGIREKDDRLKALQFFRGFRGQRAFPEFERKSEVPFRFSVHVQFVRLDTVHPDTHTRLLIYS